MNKEIKEILKKLKDKDWYEELDLTGTKWIELKQEETNLLLSYIEQLEKENDRLKKDYSIIVNENCDNLLLEKKVEQLENNRDKALEYIEKHNFMGDWGSCVFGEANLVDILKGDSDE